MDFKVIADYGGPFADALPAEDPTTQLASDFFNRLAEDAAQLTRTAPRAFVKFTAINTVAAVTISAGNARSQWGTSSQYFPSVARTATGLYTITYSASYDDGLAESETVSFFDAEAKLDSLTAVGHGQCTVAGNVVSVALFDMAGAAADFTGSTVTVRIY